MEGNKEAQKEARINTGLRNYWYPDRKSVV